jgi:hypothetical protein
VCFSKKLVRLYNTAPGMIRSGGRALQRGIDQAGSEAERKVHDMRDAEARAQKNGTPMLAVPIDRVAPTLAAMGARSGLGKATPAAYAPSAVLGALRGQRPAPIVVARDRSRIDPKSGKVMTG